MGELIGIYKARSGYFWALRLCGAAIIFMVGAILVLAIAAVESGSVSYDGPSWPIALAAVLIAVGGVIVRISFAWQPKYYLEVYEHGVIIKRKKGDVSLLFSQIEDILPIITYTPAGNPEFKVNNIAFRKDAQSEWFFVNGGFKDHFNLIEGFITLHTEQRGEALVEDIERMGSAPLKYIEKSAIRKSAFSAKSFFDVTGGYLKKYENHKTLYLAKDHIKTNDKTVYFEEGDSFEISGLTTDTIFIKDKNRKEKFALPYLSLISPDVFIAFLSSKMEFKETK
jgi:hypothetical protein